jgi:hypothetical protein
MSALMRTDPKHYSRQGWDRQLVYRTATSADPATSCSDLCSRSPCTADLEMIESQVPVDTTSL